MGYVHYASNNFQFILHLMKELRVSVNYSSNLQIHFSIWSPIYPFHLGIALPLDHLWRNTNCQVQCSKCRFQNGDGEICRSHVQWNPKWGIRQPPLFSLESLPLSLIFSICVQQPSYLPRSFFFLLLQPLYCPTLLFFCWSLTFLFNLSVPFWRMALHADFST